MMKMEVGWVHRGLASDDGLGYGERPSLSPIYILKKETHIYTQRKKQEIPP